MRHHFLFVLVVLGGALGMAAVPTAPTLKKLTKFDLPGSAGKRFDYLTIDTDDHYLLPAHLAAGQTHGIDPLAGTVVMTLGPGSSWIS